MNFIEELILSIILTAIITYVIEAFLKPQPRDIVGYWVRRIFKSWRLYGLNVKMTKAFELKEEHQLNEVLSKIGLSVGANNPLYRKLIELAGSEKKQITQFEQIGSASYRTVYETKLLNGEIQISFLVEDDGAVKSIDLSISTRDWKYSKTAEILAAMFEIIVVLERDQLRSTIDDLSGKDNLGITLEIKREPVALQYLSKLGIGLISAENQGIRYSLSKNKLTITGKFQNYIPEKIRDAMIWYL